MTELVQRSILSIYIYIYKDEGIRTAAVSLTASVQPYEIEDR